MLIVSYLMIGFCPTLGSLLSIFDILATYSTRWCTESGKRGWRRLLQPPDRWTAGGGYPTHGDALPLGSTTSPARQRRMDKQ